MPRGNKYQKQSKPSKQMKTKQKVIESSHSEENESVSDDNSDNEVNCEVENKQFEGVEYVDYDRIKDFKYKMTGDEKFITVKCFFNGKKWICPNPHAEDLCDSVENWYMSTEYIKTRLIVMPLTVFNDVLNKMSSVNTEPIILSEL